MKKTAILAGIITLFSFSAMAQTDVIKEPTAETQITSTTESKYKLLPMPAPLTIEKIFPALGSFQVTGKNGEALNVTITQDEVNKGIVYVSGLPEGTIKAHLRKSPAVYKVPAQKTAEGKSVAEGTLIFDRDANQLQVCLGCKFNDADPAIAFVQPTDEVDVKAKAKSSNKLKVSSYSGNKVDIQVTATATQQ